MTGRDPSQTSQRVKVGMIGLAAVLLLIGLAAVVFSAVNRERPLAVAGGARPDVVANLVAANASAPDAQATSEPLAELGVAPGASSTNDTAPAKPQP